MEKYEWKRNHLAYQHSFQMPSSVMIWGWISICTIGNFQIWKMRICAEKQMRSLRGLSGKAFYISVRWCQTTFSIYYNISAVPTKTLDSLNKMQISRVRQLESHSRQDWNKYFYFTHHLTFWWIVFNLILQVWRRMTNVYPITPITRSSPQTRIGHKPVNTIVTTVELNSLCAFFKKYMWN